MRAPGSNDAGVEVPIRDAPTRPGGADPATESAARAPHFSPREQQVFDLLARGHSNREIGLALGLSYLTVKEHVRHVYAKIGVTHRVAAVLWAVQNKPKEEG